jgi:hypothetical protein
MKVRTHQVQRSFPPETPGVDILIWREEMRRHLTLEHGSGGGTLVSDIGNYLNTQTKARRRNAEGWPVKWRTGSATGVAGRSPTRNCAMR